MIAHTALSLKQLHENMRQGDITLAGNRNLKIYGKMNCKSGKRMKKENRVFFKDEIQAREAGYRPCGHCMRTEYLHWKNTKS